MQENFNARTHATITFPGSRKKYRLFHERVKVMPKQVQRSVPDTAKTDATASPGRRVALAIALAVSLFAVSFLLYPHAAQAYSCNVCHGVVIWNGNQWGAQTEAEVVSLTCKPADCIPQPKNNYISTLVTSSGYSMLETQVAIQPMLAGSKLVTTP
jgi:hypothetical protein